MLEPRTSPNWVRIAAVYALCITINIAFLLISAAGQAGPL